MTEQEMMAELQANACELLGDVLSLACFCCGCETCVEELGLPAPSAYLQRIEDYFNQHVRETAQLASFLIAATRRKMLSAKQPRRAADAPSLDAL